MKGGDIAAYWRIDKIMISAHEEGVDYCIKKDDCGDYCIYAFDNQYYSFESFENALIGYVFAKKEMK